MHVLFAKVFARLHLDERLACCVAHYRNAVPIFTARVVAGDIANEDHVGTNFVEHRCGVVFVVGFTTTNRSSFSVGAVVLSNLVILHEVHHVDRAIFFRWARGECETVFLVDFSVSVFESICF